LIFCHKNKISCRGTRTHDLPIHLPHADILAKCRQSVNAPLSQQSYWLASQARSYLSACFSDDKPRPSRFAWMSCRQWAEHTLFIAYFLPRSKSNLQSVDHAVRIVLHSLLVLT
jgi:hypothetical protein